MPEPLDLSKIKPIMEKYRGQDGALIPVLQEAQALYGYLPEEVLKVVSKALRVPLSRIYGVSTFYSMFDLSSPAKYPLELCTNISCGLCGSGQVLREIETELGIRTGETTPDGLFSIREVECLATCGMGPAMRVQDRIYEELTPGKVRKIIETLRKAG